MYLFFYTYKHDTNKYVLATINDCDPCLYFTNESSVLRISWRKSTGSSSPGQVILKDRGDIRSLAIDTENKHIYWGDFIHYSINRSSLDGSNMTTLFKYGIGYPASLAIDKSSNILYWTDSLMKLIEVSETNGHNRKVLFKFDKGDMPRGMVLDDVHG